MVQVNYLLEDYLIGIFFSIFSSACPNCQMSKQQVIELYSFVMPIENAEAFVEEMFQVFDKDDSGYLDFHVCTIHFKIVKL